MDEYIKKIEEYVKNNNLSEELLIRYVYLDLGLHLSFNPEFKPFGNSKKRQEIYRHSSSIDDLNECMDTNLVICKSAAYILKYVLSYFGVSIKVVVDPFDMRKCPHVYNVITQSNGLEYIVDLQEDMYFIKMHASTKNYGISTKDLKTNVISRFHQQEMDLKLGFIKEDNFYTDEYVYNLKHAISLFDNFYDKVHFVLENIDIFENKEINYTDRQWYHVRILEQLFDKSDFDYYLNTGKIHFIDCYKDINGKRKYLNCVTVQNGCETEIYLYNYKYFKYQKISFDSFAYAVNNGLVLHNSKIHGLKERVKKYRKV